MCVIRAVPRTYQCGLDQYGRRRDHNERPELRFGSCDFAVPASYNVRAAPQIPTFVFVVDVSFYAVANGALQVPCRVAMRCDAAVMMTAGHPGVGLCCAGLRGCNH